MLVGLFVCLLKQVSVILAVMQLMLARCNISTMALEQCVGSLTSRGIIY